MKPEQGARFDAVDLARRQARVAGTLPLADLDRLAPLLGATDGAIDFEVQGRVDEQGRPGAHLSLGAVLKLVCQRCGRPIDWRLARSVDFLFVASEAELDRIPLDDDAREAVLAEEASELAAWIEDEAILSLPLVPRHESCEVPVEARPDRAAGSEHRLAGLADALARAKP